MGVWGVKMLDNDTARDATSEFKEFISQVADGQQTPSKLFKEVIRSYGNDSLAILGISQVLLDNGVDLRPLKRFISPYIKEELGPKELNKWKRPKARRNALLLFRKSLLKKPPTKKVKTRKYKVGMKIRIKGDYKFSEGLAPVYFESINKMGFIDRNKRIVIEPVYDTACNFYGGLAAVEVNRKWGYINKKGEMVIKPSFNIAGNF